MQYYHPNTNNVLSWLEATLQPTKSRGDDYTRSEFWIRITGVILQPVFYTHVLRSTLSSFLFVKTIFVLISFAVIFILPHKSPTL